MKVDPSELLTLYERRYNGDMKFQTSPKGLHSAIVSELADQLERRDVLDIGCGAGRLALFAGARGARVDALDFSPQAIALAQKVSSSLTRPLPDVDFHVGRFEDLDRQFDVVLMTEVFEHIPTPPQQTLRQLRDLIAPGGVAVVSSPGFVNFRGISWMTLQHLFGFLMSPSDLHFIQPWDMRRWCEEEGLVIDRHLGLFHDWGWGGWAARDMKQRVGLALRDQRAADPAWETVPIDLDRLAAYLDEQTRFFQEVLDRDIRPSLLESVVPLEELQLREDVLATPFGLQMQDYLSDARVPYANRAPLNALGATNIFFCRHA
jgi:2-polyprenyl-3-methyl-5-hydroxy-6-metoxy-1,4-benzoquinol methylase